MLSTYRFEGMNSGPLKLRMFCPSMRRSAYILQLMERFQKSYRRMILTEGKSLEEDGLVYAGEILETLRTSNGDYIKKLKVRRLLICRVCKSKFGTRQETQTHIRSEHRQLRTGRQQKWLPIFCWVYYELSIENSVLDSFKKNGSCNSFN